MPTYKKCDTCKNKTCIKTKKICKSMDAWLKRFVEKPQQNKLMNKKEHGYYDYLTQGIDNK